MVFILNNKLTTTIDIDKLSCLDKCKEHLSTLLKLTSSYEEELNKYKKLEKDGYIYRKKKNEIQYTLREILFKILVEEENYDPKDIIKSLNFKLKRNDSNNLEKSLEKEMTQRTYSKLALMIGREYKKTNEGHSAPRVKQKVETDDIIKGVSGLGNVYSRDFAYPLVKDFLEDHPFSSWHIKEEVDFDDAVKCGNKWSCKFCKKNGKDVPMSVSSLKRHFTTKKHNEMKK